MRGTRLDQLPGHISVTVSIDLRLTVDFDDLVCSGLSRFFHC